MSTIATAVVKALSHNSLGYQSLPDRADVERVAQLLIKLGFHVIDKGWFGVVFEAKEQDLLRIFGCPQAAGKELTPNRLKPGPYFEGLVSDIEISDPPRF